MRLNCCIIAFLLAVPAWGETYPYITAKYSFSSLGGVTTLTVHLHNNGGKNAACRVSVVNREERTRVEAFGDSDVSFQSYTSGEQPRYSCSAD